MLTPGPITLFAENLAPEPANSFPSIHHQDGSDKIPGQTGVSHGQVFKLKKAGYQILGPRISTPTIIRRKPSQSILFEREIWERKRTNQKFSSIQITFVSPARAAWRAACVSRSRDKRPCLVQTLVRMAYRHSHFFNTSSRKPACLRISSRPSSSSIP